MDCIYLWEDGRCGVQEDHPIAICPCEDFDDDKEHLQPWEFGYERTYDSNFIHRLINFFRRK